MFITWQCDKYIITNATVQLFNKQQVRHMHIYIIIFVFVEAYFWIIMPAAIDGLHAKQEKRSLKTTSFKGSGELSMLKSVNLFERKNEIDRVWERESVIPIFFFYNDTILSKRPYKTITKAKPRPKGHKPY